MTACLKKCRKALFQGVQPRKPFFWDGGGKAPSFVKGLPNLAEKCGAHKPYDKFVTRSLSAKTGKQDKK
jgi:hypothetical protein